jgi:hypothetical protein
VLKCGAFQSAEYCVPFNFSSLQNGEHQDTIGVLRMNWINLNKGKVMNFAWVLHLKNNA